MSNYHTPSSYKGISAIICKENPKKSGGFGFIGSLAPSEKDMILGFLSTLLTAIGFVSLFAVMKYAKTTNDSSIALYALVALISFVVIQYFILSNMDEMKCYFKSKKQFNF
jgi:hypothetical protein